MRVLPLCLLLFGCSSVPTPPKVNPAAPGRSRLEDPAASGVADMTGPAHPTVLVVLKDHPAPVPFVIDTGAPVSAVSDWLARELGLARHDDLEVVIGGYVSEGLASVNLPSITVAGLTFHDVPAMILDVEKLGERVPSLACMFHRFGGIIGNDLLSQGRWQIDFERGRLANWGPEASVPDPDGLPSWWCQLMACG